MILRDIETKSIRLEQKAISEKDLYSLNDVVQSPDFIVVEDARNINTALVFVKNMPDGSTILVENVGNKKKRLLAKTMRIKRRAISGDELSTLYPTSETLPSVNIIIDTSDIKSNKELLFYFLISSVTPSVRTDGSQIKTTGRQLYIWKKTQRKCPL